MDFSRNNQVHSNPLIEKSSGLDSDHINEYLYNPDSYIDHTIAVTPSKKASHSMENTFLTLLALTLIAFFTSCVAIFIDLTAYFLIFLKKYWILEIENIWLGYFAWIFSSLVFITCATSFGYFIAPQADGSGIPEVKVILSGAEIPHFLDVKTLFAKVFGLICCSGALSIGKEGPHVHISTIIAHKVLKFAVFQRLKKHPGIQARIMESSVTAGVAAVMAAPIGSVFFSMELTATFYIVQNIVFALYCAVLSSLFLSTYRLLHLTEIVNTTSIPKEFNNFDLIFFFVIGTVCGVFGVIFTKITKQLVYYRSQKKIPWLHKRYRYAIFITFLYSATAFTFPFMILSAKGTMNELLSTESLPESWNYLGVAWSLAVFSILKPTFTAVSTSVQIPGGVILPILISGAAFGRLVHFCADYVGGIANPAMYAAVGGASLVSSTTHSWSIALIIFEMTGEIHYAVPMILGVVISYNIGCSLGLNIFDAMIVMKKIQYFPAIRKTGLYRLYAHEVMSHVVSVKFSTNFKGLRDSAFDETTKKVAVVDENNFLIGDFNRKAVQKYLIDYLDALKDHVSTEKYERTLKNIKNKEFEEENEPVRLSLPSLQRGISVEVIRDFWDTPVDFYSRFFKINTDPVWISHNTPLSKVHYLFLMLGSMQIYVTKDYKLVGVIYRHYFTN